jgi:hypothetical protein
MEKGSLKGVATVMQVAESDKASVDVTILGLPTCDFLVDADETTESVKEAFDDRVELSGAIVVDGEYVLEVVSRDSLFRHLSRPFFREIFLKRPIREFVKMWCGEMLCLEANCTIHRAAEMALARSHERVFEPILVDYGDRVGLLDTQVQLVAQAQLLSVSRLIEEQRDAAEIPLAARIAALADVYDALTSPRIYKPAFGAEAAREVILHDSGSHFDPIIVDAFLTRFEDFQTTAINAEDVDMSVSIGTQEMVSSPVGRG